MLSKIKAQNYFPGLDSTYTNYNGGSIKIAPIKGVNCFEYKFVEGGDNE
jgi:hypothetical protein